MVLSALPLPGSAPLAAADPAELELPSRLLGAPAVLLHGAAHAVAAAELFAATVAGRPAAASVDPLSNSGRVGRFLSPCGSTLISLAPRTELGSLGGTPLSSSLRADGRSAAGTRRVSEEGCCIDKVLTM